jgi:drug/metabolite transporter (DMT)-like permease
LGWPLLAGSVLGVLGLTGLFYEQAPWTRGDTLTLISAFVYAVYVLMFEFSARARTPLRPERIALAQSGTMVLLASIGFVALEPASWSDLWLRGQAHWAVLAYLGVLASALMVWLQAWGQHRVRAVEAAIIYGLEPVFAALTAVWWINETMSGRALLGGALIVLGVVISQLPTSSKPS